MMADMKQPSLVLLMLLLPVLLSTWHTRGAFGADVVIPPARTTTSTPSTNEVVTSASTSATYVNVTQSPTVSTPTTSLRSNVTSNYTMPLKDSGEGSLPSESGIIIGASVGTAVFLVAVAAFTLVLLYTQGLIGGVTKSFTPVPTQPPAA